MAVARHDGVMARHHAMAAIDAPWGRWDPAAFSPLRPTGPGAAGGCQGGEAELRRQGGWRAEASWDG